MCILKLRYHCCLFAFPRLNLSRWMRRIRPILWCLWPPCPRNPSTSRLSTASLHQKTGPTPPPPLTDILPPRTQWLTQRCESRHPDLIYPSPTGTHYPQAPLLPHKLSTHWDKFNTNPPDAFTSPQPAPLGTLITMTMKLMTDDDNDNACNVKRLGSLAFAGVSRSLSYICCVWDWALTGIFFSLPDFGPVVTIIVIIKYNRICADDPRQWSRECSISIHNRGAMKPLKSGSWKETGWSFCTFVKRNHAHYFSVCFPLTFRKCLFL